MKTIVIESASPLSWYFIADSALVNAGKPFFIPEFADEFEAFLAPVVRISRIGKSIAARFAERYYTEIAPAVHFRASKLRRQLLEAGLPTDPSHSFDRAMTVGSFLPTSEFLNGSPLLMLKEENSSMYKEVKAISSTHESREVAECDSRKKEMVEESFGRGKAEAVVKIDTNEMRSMIGPLLEAVSRSNTIKMGDYLVPILSNSVKVEIGDTLTVTLASTPLLTIHIK